MAELHTQAIIDALMLALGKVYPAAVILEQASAGDITSPIFLVQLVTAKQQPLMGLRYRRTPLFDVTYCSPDSPKDCVAVGDNLCLVLATVETAGGDVLHGSDMNWSMREGTLHFMVQYNHIVTLPRAYTEMDSLTIGEGTV